MTAAAAAAAPVQVRVGWLAGWLESRGPLAGLQSEPPAVRLGSVVTAECRVFGHKRTDD